MPNEYYYNLGTLDLYNFRDKEKAMQNYCLRMLNRSTQIFKYNGLPDSIPDYMLERILQMGGFAAFAKYKDTLYAFSGGLGGEPDVYYRPTVFTVSNPALNFSKQLEIDKDCIIMKNDSSMMGLCDMFRRYATAMVENDISFDKASKNLRVAFLIAAPDDDTKDSADKFINDIETGESASIAENGFFEGVTVQPMQHTANRTLTELIEYHQYLRASWFNELGLNANYNMKRESLTTAESDMNFDALLPLIDDMLICRQEALKKINKMFNTDISVSLNSAWKDIHETLTKKPDNAPEPETENESEVKEDVEEPSETK